MLHSRLGELVELAGEGPEESRRWRDDGDVSVTLQLKAGRTRSWALQRPGESASASGAHTS
jgi:hypothetical protein